MQISGEPICGCGGFYTSDLRKVYYCKEFMDEVKKLVKGKSIDTIDCLDKEIQLKIAKDFWTLPENYSPKYAPENI